MKLITINLRASIATRNLIDRGAMLEDKNRTEFMLESACLRAQEILLEKQIFMLPPDEYDKLMSQLTAPPLPSNALRVLLKDD